MLRVLFLDEEGSYLEAFCFCLHFGVGGAGLVAAGGVEDFGEEVDVADGVEEEVGAVEDPVDGAVDVGLVFEGLVPGGVGVFFVAPGAAGDGFDGLDGDVAVLTELDEGFEVGGVLGVLHHDVVVGEEDGVEVEFLEAALVHGGDGGAVAGDADIADEALVAGFEGGLEGAAGAHGGFPFEGVDEVVELEEVYLVDLKAFEGGVDLVFGFLVGAEAGFGGEEEVLAVVGHPGGEAEFGLAVAGGGVDVVDAVLEEEVEGLVGFFLGDAAEGGCAEDDAGAVVAGAAEGYFGDH